MLEAIKQLKAKYKDVVWVTRTKDKPRAEGDVHVYVHVNDEYDLEAKILVGRSKKLVVPFEQLDANLTELFSTRGSDKKLAKIAYADSMRIGYRLIEDAGGTYRRVGSRYLQAYFKNDISAWLRFSTTRQTRSKDWSPDRLMRLYADGMYAWIVRLDIDGKKLRLSYPFNTYHTQERGLSGGGLMMCLEEGTKFADARGWRDEEIARYEAHRADN